MVEAVRASEGTCAVSGGASAAAGAWVKVKPGGGILGGDVTVRSESED